MTAQVIHADCLDALAAMAENSVDSCVTDPPYHLTTNKKGGTGPASLNLNSPAGRARISTGFMGKAWDGGDIAFRPETWAAVLRVLKPGAHLLAFGGTRTYHRMVCAVEDAGFEIRDSIQWHYGSGFPKSRNLDGDWRGWGTALKPATELIVLARKPLSEPSVAANVMRWGTGAINIDGCRVHGEDAMGGEYVVKRLKPGATLNATGGNWRPEDGPEYRGTMKLGRWPANVIHDGCEEVLEAFPDAPGQILDASTDNDARKTQTVYGAMRRGRGDEPSADSENDGAVGFKMKPGARRADAGSAARFFYCPKASPSDRDDGLDNFEIKQHVQFATAKGTSGKASSISAGRDTRRANTHPTVKPTELMRYLCRLVTPPSGTVLDPFAGSGSTGRGAILEGFNFIGIEREEEYVSIARARIQAAQDRVHARTEEAEKAIFKASELPSLFGVMAPPHPHTPPLDTQAGAE